MYLGTGCVPWLTTEELLAHFDAREERARQLYQEFVRAGIEETHLSLTDLGKMVNREVSALSRAAGRIRERGREEPGLAEKLDEIRKTIILREYVVIVAFYDADKVDGPVKTLFSPRRPRRTRRKN